MEDNEIMTTSMIQYLDEIHTYMNSHTAYVDNIADILKSDKNDAKEEIKESEIESVEQIASSEINPLDIDHQDQLSLFNSKVRFVAMAFS